MSRTNKTKNLLAKSLTELMASMPLEKISVNDIVEHAGVGRNTFYYHFEDKFDLVNWYFQSGVTQFLVERGHYASWPDLLCDLEIYLRENRTFYTNALAYTGQNCLREYIFHYTSALFAQRMAASNPGSTEADQRFVGDFLSGALMGILLPWVQGGMRESGLRSINDSIRVLCHSDLSELMGYGLNDDLPNDNN